MLNKVIIMGRIGKDVELRRTQSGVAVTSFRIACERDFKDQDGERETDWIDVVAWRNTAEFIQKYFGKGRMIVVDGRLQVRPWTDKDGNQRFATEVVAESVYFGDSKTEKQAPAQSYDLPQRNDDGFTEIDEEDGELPF